jgi:hypothetical protein
MPQPSPISGHEPAFYRFVVGNREAAVVSDGPLLLTPPGEVFTTLAPNLIEAALRDAFLPPGPMRIEQNVLLLNYWNSYLFILIRWPSTYPCGTATICIKIFVVGARNTPLQFRLPSPPFKRIL